MANDKKRELRADAVLAAAVLLLGFLLCMVGAGLVQSWRLSSLQGQSLQVENILGAAAAATGAAIVVWWLFSLLCAGATALLERAGTFRAAAVTRRLSPAFMRRLVLAALSMQLMTGPAAHAGSPISGPGWAPTQGQSTSAPAGAGSDKSPTLGTPHPVVSHPGIADTEAAFQQAGSHEAPPEKADVQQPEEQAVTVPSPSTIQPAWQPAAPMVPPGLLAAPAVRPELPRHENAVAPDAVTVLSGDSLWDIVADRLGPGTSDVEIALHWPRWYEANRALIGQNPDVLLPGQILLPPPPA